MVYIHVLFHMFTHVHVVFSKLHTSSSLMVCVVPLLWCKVREVRHEQTWLLRRSSSRSRQQTGAWTLWSGFSGGSQQKALLQELQGKSRPCGRTEELQGLKKTEVNVLLQDSLCGGSGCEHHPGHQRSPPEDEDEDRKLTFLLHLFQN